jgi:hypothetical protein
MITKEYKTKYSNSQKKKFCSRCYYDRYNYPGTCERPGIDAPVTSKQCWSLNNARVVKKEVYLSSYQTKPSNIKTLSCFMPKR